MKPYLKYIPQALFSLAIAGSAVAKLTKAPPLLESFATLGYPSYLLSILGSAYILGLIALWQPKSDRIREWAFAGFGIAMIGAFSSHILAGDPVVAAVPAVVLLALLAASYWIASPTPKQATA